MRIPLISAAIVCGLALSTSAAAQASAAQTAPLQLKSGAWIHAADGAAIGRIEYVDRAKDLVKVKGMLINPAVLLETLQSIPGIDEFQVVVRRENTSDPLSMDELVVRVAGADHAALADTVIARARDAIRVRVSRQTSDSRTRERMIRLISAGMMLSAKSQRHERPSTSVTSSEASAASR